MSGLEKLSFSLKVVNDISSDQLAESTLLVHYCHLAAFIITVYDHLITFDNEVKYIWTRKWSKSTLLYFSARYFGDFLLAFDCYLFLNRNADTPVFVSFSLCEVNAKILMISILLPNHFSCTVGIKFVGSGAIMIIMITQVIMQLRIKSLYGKAVSIIISSFWSLQIVILASLSIVSIVGMEVHPIVLGLTSVCHSTYLPPYAYLLWLPVITFETFLFFLSLRIAYRNYLEIGHWGGTTLITVVLRDNFFFFFLAFAAYIITTITWVTLEPEFFTVPASFACSLTTIMGCRLILNLCDAYHNPNPSIIAPGSIWSARSTPGIRFVIPADSTISVSSSSIWHSRRASPTWATSSSWSPSRSDLVHTPNLEAPTPIPAVLSDKSQMLTSCSTLLFTENNVTV